MWIFAKIFATDLQFVFWTKICCQPGKKVVGSVLLTSFLAVCCCVVKAAGQPLVVMQSDRALLEQQLFGTNAQPFSTDECVLEERTTLAAHHHRLDTICGLLRAPLQQPPPEATTVTLPCDALSYLRTQLPGGLWRLLKSKVPEGPTQPILVEARAELFQHVIELFVAGLEADVVFPSEVPPCDSFSLFPFFFHLRSRPLVVYVQLFELLEGVFDGEGHSCTFYKEHGKLTPKPKKVGRGGKGKATTTRLPSATVLSGSSALRFACDCLPSFDSERSFPFRLSLVPTVSPLFSSLLTHSLTRSLTHFGACLRATTLSTLMLCDCFLCLSMNRRGDRKEVCGGSFRSASLAVHICDQCH